MAGARNRSYTDRAVKARPSGVRRQFLLTRRSCSGPRSRHFRGLPRLREEFLFLSLAPFSWCETFPREQSCGPARGGGETPF